jgi:hypothetical protein
MNNIEYSQEESEAMIEKMQRNHRISLEVIDSEISSLKTLIFQKEKFRAELIEEYNNDIDDIAYYTKRQE